MTEHIRRVFTVSQKKAVHKVERWTEKIISKYNLKQ